jgi:capsular polysaccharide biosynthesis protein
LLVGLPVGKNDLYPFVYETLELLGISKEDLIFVNKNTLYKRIIVGSSLTHNRQSQNPPHNAIYDIFDRLKDAVSDEIDSDRIYVSRRTWHDTDAGNIGTDYTKERMCVNENKVVEIFKEFDFNEVFCEKLSMRSKISLFKSADYIAGPIGGGLSNVLFSNSSTKVISIDSPEFFEINKRLQYAMSHTKLYHFDNTSFVDRKEPIEISDYSLSISGGMNSHWQVDTNKLYAYLKNTIK